MANPKGNPKNLIPWVKGQSGNPKGGPSLPKELRDVRLMSRLEASALLNRLKEMSTPELEKLKNDDSVPAFHKIIATVILEGIKHGDVQRLGFLMDRLVGKVKDELEVSVAKPIVTEIDCLNGKKLELGSNDETDDE